MRSLNKTGVESSLTACKDIVEAIVSRVPAQEREDARQDVIIAALDISSQSSPEAFRGALWNKGRNAVAPIKHRVVCASALISSSVACEASADDTSLIGIELSDLETKIADLALAGFTQKEARLSLGMSRERYQRARNRLKVKLIALSQ